MCGILLKHGNPRHIGVRLNLVKWESAADSMRTKYLLAF
jgi:hypothetical protein